MLSGYFFHFCLSPLLVNVDFAFHRQFLKAEKRSSKKISRFRHNQLNDNIQMPIFFPSSGCQKLFSLEKKIIIMASRINSTAAFKSVIKFE